MSSVKSKENNNFNIVAIVALVLAAIGVFAAPYYLSQPASSPNYDFSNKGDIGSLIGGVTAPIIGLVSAFLVYIAFRVQYLANKRQWDEINKDRNKKSETDIVNLFWKMNETATLNISDERMKTLRSTIYNGSFTADDKLMAITDYIGLIRFCLKDIEGMQILVRGMNPNVVSDYYFPILKSQIFSVFVRLNMDYKNFESYIANNDSFQSYLKNRDKLGIFAKSLVELEYDVRKIENNMK